jgi:diaminopimelate decarboxylase
MNTPFFIIDEKKLKKNVFDFKNALSDYWPNSQLAYSVKTNSLPWLLKYLYSYGVMAEVVSDEEYDLAIQCGYPENEIIFNGPIKSNESIIRAIRNGAIVNIDSKNEMTCIQENHPSQSGTIGFRINVDTSSFVIGDVDFVEEGFRFGFSEESGELGNIISKLVSLYGNDEFGLHFHCNSITRSLGVYKSITQYAAKIIKKYNICPTYLDLGGGFFGGMEGKPTAMEYLAVIRNELEDVIDINKTKLLIEPGSAIIGSPVDYYVTVMDVKDIKNRKIVTTDGSRIHIDPLWKKNRYIYTIHTKNKNQEIQHSQIICGYTCMDHDRIMTVSNIPELQVGDILVFHKVGAYTVTFGGPFIRYLPDVYIKNNNEIKLIRKRMSVEQYFKTQFVEED